MPTESNWSESESVDAQTIAPPGMVLSGPLPMLGTVVVATGPPPAPPDFNVEVRASPVSGGAINSGIRGDDVGSQH